MLMDLPQEKIIGFDKFLKSNYSKMPIVIQTFNYVKKYHPKFDHPYLEKDIIKKKLLGKSDGNNGMKTLMNTFSELSYILEYYLIVDKIRNLSSNERRELLSNLLSGENDTNEFKKDKDYYEYKFENIPDELITPLQQYFLFFREFVETAKGEKINFDVLKTNNGLRFVLKINSNSNLTIGKIKEFLDEYIGIVKNQTPSSFKVKKGVNDDDIMYLKLRLERQVENLNWELRIRNEKIILLNQKIEELKTDKGELFKLIKSSIDGSGTNEKSIKIIKELKNQCRDLLGKNEIHEVFGILKEFFDNKEEKLNEIILLQFNWETLFREKNLGKISNEFFNIESSRIIGGILFVIEKIK